MQDVLSLKSHVFPRQNIQKITSLTLSPKTRLNQSRIAVLSKGYNFAVSQMATHQISGIFVPLSLSNPASEHVYTIQDSGASLILVDKSLAHLVSPEMRDGVEVYYMDEIEARRVDDLGLLDEYVVKFSETCLSSTPATLVYTSGTTSRPKGVIHTHTSLAAQMQSMMDGWKWSERDYVLNVLPLHHVHGLVNVLGTSLAAGACCEMCDRMDVKAVWERWVKSLETGRSGDLGHITLFMAVPTIYVKLLAHYHDSPPEIQVKYRDACKQFRLMVSGSAALPTRVWNEWQSATGHRLLERYGMTEIGMALTNPLKESLRVPGMVGFPFPNVLTRVDVETGELGVKGPQVFKGYWKLPDKTAECFDEKGWFKTGDIVSTDRHGRFTVLGRASTDIIKVSGYKVGAVEIERVIGEVGWVTDVSVMGIEDLVKGEAVAALVVVDEKKLGSVELDVVQTLKTHCKTHLPHYKVPSVWKVTKELPRNIMGKVDKKKCKAMIV